MLHMLKVIARAFDRQTISPQSLEIVEPAPTEAERLRRALIDERKQKPTNGLHVMTWHETARQRCEWAKRNCRPLFRLKPSQAALGDR